MLQLNFPSFPILATERLILRAHTSADSKVLFALRTNETVMKYIYRERPKNIQDIEEKIALMNSGFKDNSSLVWVIALKEKPAEMIGEIGFYRTDYANYRAEIGYMLHPDYWRKGIISEALIKAIAFGFKNINLHSICADVSPENSASRQILIKHGFKKEAYFKERYYFQGKFLDSEIYSLINNSNL